MNRNRMMRTRRALAVAISVCGAIGGSTFAQEAAELEEVVVTGSRIAVDNAESAPSPIQVLDSESIAASGEMDLSALLRETPALNASLPSSFSAFQGPAAGSPGSTDDDLGIGFLNLRNLGAVRTLVLVNGRRHVAGAQGAAAVDVNTIPTLMTKRVEIMTGGASSVYGADAVTGVVNYILKDASDFDGFEFTAQTGVSGRNDGEQISLSGAGGFEFLDGRASVVVGVEYMDSEEVFDFKRPFTGQFRGDDLNNTPEIAALTGRNPAAQRVYVRPEGNPISSPFGVFDLTNIDAFGSIDGVFSNPDYRPGDPIPIIPGSEGFGRVPGGPLTGGIPALQVIDTPGGVARVYNPGFAINTSQSFLVGDGLGSILGTMMPKAERVVANINSRFDLTDNHTLFLEAKYANTDTSERQGGADFNDSIPIAFDNPYIPDNLAEQITFLQTEGIIGPDPADGSFYGFGSSRDTQDLAVLPTTSVERETIRVVAGIEGMFDVLGGIDYELSFNYGETTADIDNEGTRIEDRFYAALDSVVDPNSGEIVCRSDLDATALPPVAAAFPTPEFTTGNFTANGRYTEFVSFTPGDGSCVPFDPFGRNAATPEYAAFVYQSDVDKTELEQTVVFGSLAGDSSAFFELPAGPLAWVVGGEYRKEESSFVVGPFEQSGVTWNGSNGNRRESLSGDFDVTEYFFELAAPLLADLPAFEYLEVTGAMRFADYDTIGSNDAWSVGGRWEILPGITLRGTVSEAVRAPNIAELFSPQQPAFYPFLNDPCSIQNINLGSEFRAANCAQLVPAGYDVTQFVTAGIPGVTGGNPDLSEETAETTTFGIVLAPEQWIPGLRIIIDYYEIEIDGAIDALSALRVSEACVDLPTTANNFCPLITRAATGQVIDHRSGQVNLGSVETSGIDFSVTYDFTVGSFGDFTVGVSGNKLEDWKEFQDPIDTTVFEDRVGEFTYPEYIMNGRVNWSLGALSLGWAVRYEDSQLLPGISNEDLAANPLFVDPNNTGRGIVHNISGSYEVSDNLTVRGAIRNAFDEHPYLGTLSRPAGPMGRFFSVTAQYRM